MSPTIGGIDGRRLLFVEATREDEGPAAHFTTIVRAMADAGHEVAAVVRADGFVDRALTPDRRIRVFAARGRRDTVRMTSEVIRAARATRPEWMVGTLERAHWPLAAIARLLGARTVLFSHRDQWMLPWVPSALARLAHRIVAPSEYQRGRLIGRGMPPDRVVVLYHPVDTARLRVDEAARSEARGRLGFRGDDVVVGFAGPLEPENGVEAFAMALRRAMDRNPSVRALWVGTGECGARLQECVDRWGHGARHVWLPWCPDPFPHCVAMDLLALPSLGCEPLGRSLVEAQACGVPVLGSRAGGIPETMEPGVTGLLLPPASVAEWADAILLLAADAPERRRMGIVGREFVRRVFDARVIAAELGRLLADASPPAPLRMR